MRTTTFVTALIIHSVEAKWHQCRCTNGNGRSWRVGFWARSQSGVAIRICIALLAWLLLAGRVTAQSDATNPSAEQQKAEREYAETLGRVKQGDMTVDFR